MCISGGLGLTSGICDVGGLYECLAGINKGVADDSILDKYSEIRREKYLTIVDPISSSNFKRLWEKTPEETIKTDPFFPIAVKAEKDPIFGKELIQVGATKVLTSACSGSLTQSRVRWLYVMTSHNITSLRKVVGSRDVLDWFSSSLS